MGAEKVGLGLGGGWQFVEGQDFRLWEVAQASSAAPTYFPGTVNILCNCVGYQESCLYIKMSLLRGAIAVRVQ